MGVRSHAQIYIMHSNTVQEVPRPSQRKVCGRIGCLQVAVLSLSQAPPTTTPITITNTMDATRTMVTIPRTTIQLVKLAVLGLVVAMVITAQTPPYHQHQRTGHLVLWITTTLGKMSSFCILYSSSRQKDQ